MTNSEYYEKFKDICDSFAPESATLSSIDDKTELENRQTFIYNLLTTLNGYDYSDSTASDTIIAFFESVEEGTISLLDMYDYFGTSEIASDDLESFISNYRNLFGSSISYIYNDVKVEVIGDGAVSDLYSLNSSDTNGKIFITDNPVTPKIKIAPNIKISYTPSDSYFTNDVDATKAYFSYMSSTGYSKLTTDSSGNTISFENTELSSLWSKITENSGKNTFLMENNSFKDLIILIMTSDTSALTDSSNTTVLEKLMGLGQVFLTKELKDSVAKSLIDICFKYYVKEIQIFGEEDDQFVFSDAMENYEENDEISLQELSTENIYNELFKSIVALSVDNNLGRTSTAGNNVIEYFEEIATAKYALNNFIEGLLNSDSRFEVN